MEKKTWGTKKAGRKKTVPIRALMLGLFLSCLSLFPVHSARAESVWGWATDVLVADYPTIGSPNQDSNEIVTASDGNFILAWSDDSGRVMVQKANSQATDRVTDFEMWTSGGVQIGNTQGYNIDMIPDNAGGAFIAWYYGGWPINNIWVQHVDTNGNILWTSGGVQITSNTQYEYNPQIVPDGNGGVVVAWYYYNTGLGNTTIYATRLNSSGNVDVNWNTGGGGTFRPVAMPKPAGITSSYISSITPDGLGNYFISYYVNPNNIFYVNKMDNTGAFITSGNWGAGGYGIIADNASGYNYGPFKPVLDGSNGIMYFYYFYDLSWNTYLKGQRIDANGNVLWTSSGITYTTPCDTVLAVGDGGGNAIVVWADSSVDQNYAQKIDGNGNTVWAGNTSVTDPADGYQQTPVDLISNSNGGAIVSFESSETTNLMLIQSISSAGAIEWPSSAPSYNGLKFGTTSVNGGYSPELAGDGNGGAAFTWIGYDASWWQDLYMQYIVGLIPGAAPDAVTDLAATPGTLEISLTWSAPADNGNPISGYTIFYGEETGPNACDPTTSPYTNCSSTTSATTNKTVTGLSYGVTYIFGAYAQNGHGFGPAGNTVTETPACDVMNPQNGQFCASQTISSSTLTFVNLPDSFTFGEITAGSIQDLFNNNNTTNPPTPTSPGADLLKVFDDRGSGGFIVDIDTAGTFTDGTHTIDLTNLYIVTSLDETDPNNGDPGSGEQAGVTYDVSIPSAQRTVSAPVYVDMDTADLASRTTYTGLGAAAQFGGSALVLMDGTLPAAQGRNGNMWQFANFHLRIPSTQAAGNYDVTLTYTLSDSTTP